MEINIDNPEKELSDMIKHLIEKEDNSSETVEPDSSSDGTNGEGASTLSDITINYPNVQSEFFKSTHTESSWWERNKLFFVFVLLVVFAAFVFCRLICCVCDNKVPSGNLLFFFGVITLLFVGLIVHTYFIIKASEKHRAEKNERDNQMLAFRLKILESAFELENVKLIAAKHRIEEEISITDKEKLYALDEQQRSADHERRMKLKKYEILDNYMKHLVDLAKTTKEKSGD